MKQRLPEGWLDEALARVESRLSEPRITALGGSPVEEADYTCSFVPAACAVFQSRRA